MVLKAVYAVEEQLASRGVADAGNILVALLAGIYLTGLLGVEVVDVERNYRVLLASLGVLKFVCLVVEVAIKTHHLELLDTALVKLKVGNLTAIRREGIGLRKAVLLLIHPVGGAVDDVIPPPLKLDKFRIKYGNDHIIAGIYTLGICFFQKWIRLSFLSKSFFPQNKPDSAKKIGTAQFSIWRIMAEVYPIVVSIG